MPSQNRIFTGREDELARLHAALQTGDAALTPAPAALHGMGGVGKTQTAVEYAHRHRTNFAFVFWTRGETPESFQSQLAGLAPELDPPVPTLADQNATLQAVHRWFETHTDWLLVVANAERLSQLRDLLPRHPSGRILLTTRETVPTTLAESIEIHHLDEATGATLLLRRAGRLQPDQALATANAAMQAEAKAVSAELGGLALALDQAGAYMHERSLTPARYLAFYRKRRQSLHGYYKTSDHQSVTITFELALEQVQQIPEFGLAAAALAQVCAFLAPDVIPDEIFLQGASLLGKVLFPFAADEIAFADEYEAACRYALLRRESDPPGLWMHRLAQEVVRDILAEDERKVMAERIVLAVNLAFPVPDFPIWSLCKRLLPHALVCAQYITDYDLHTAQAARLLNNTAWYLKERARYGEAEPLFQEALEIRRQLHGEEHPDVATTLNNLALLCRETGRYDEAVSYLEKAVEIGRKTIGEDSPEYAIHLDNLGQVYYKQYHYEKAAVLGEQALEITRRTLGMEHPHVAIRLNNLALVYGDTGRYAEVVSLLAEALAIDRKTIGENDPSYATRLFNLAVTYILWGRPAEAEPMLWQALSILEQALGKEHPQIAQCHVWLGVVRHAEGKRAEAAEQFRRALEIQERTLGPQHPDTVNTRKNLALVG